jgi:TolA-binding protein
MENREKAIAAYEDLLKTYPGTGYVYQANYGLGLARQKIGRFEEAAEAFRIAEKTNNLEIRLDAMFHLGEVLRDAGRSEEALEVFYEIAVTFENDDLGPRAYWEAAQLQEALGKKDKVKVTLQYLIKTYPNSGEAAKATATLGGATQE